MLEPIYKIFKKINNLLVFLLLQFHQLDLQNNDNHQFVLIVQVNDEEIHLMDVFDYQVLVDQF
jgi:hypothetical protein